MIIRKQKTEYTIVPNDIINDELSLQALGLLVWMLSKPNDWVFNREYMQVFFKIGESKLQGIINELKKHGYIQVVKSSNGKGGIASQTIVSEDKNTYRGFSSNENIEPRIIHPSKDSSLEKVPDILNTDSLLNTDTILNTDEYISKQPEPKFSVKKWLLEKDVREDIANKFIKYRKDIRKPLNENAINNLEIESRKAGVTIEQAILIVLEKEWRGFKAHYMKGLDNIQNRHKNAAKGGYNAFDDVCRQEEDVFVFDQKPKGLL